MDVKVVKLGLMPPLTGLVGIYGSEIVHAAQVACQEVNEKGGVLGRPLELVIEDDGSLPESAVSAAEKLVSEHHCPAIIGNLLSNSRIAVTYRVAEPNRVPLLNFSFYEGSILSRYFFHFAALPNQQIDQMIPYMASKFGSKMFFAGNNYEWPRGSINAAKLVLEKSGGEVVGEEYCPIGVEAETIEALLDHVEAANPDVFVPYFAGADQVMLLTRFTERGLKKNIAVVMGHYDEMMASQLPADVREGFFSSNTYFMTVDSAENRNYLQRLSKLPDVNGIWPNGNGIVTNFGEGTYACVKAFALAANQAGSINSEELVEALKNINVSAPQGEIQMNPEHHHAKVNTYLSLCQSNGEFNIVENFGAIEPQIPDRYKHQRIAHQATVEEDIRLQSRMLQQMTDGILLIGTSDASIIFSNLSAENMFGYGKGKMNGLSMYQINDTDEEYLQQSVNDIISILNSKGEWDGETKNLKKDGSSIWCSASITTFTHPVYGEVWLAVHRDINDLKNTETALRDNEKQLKEAQRIAKVGGWELNILESKLIWSDETYRIFEIDKSQTNISYDLFLSCIHPDDRDKVNKAYSDSLLSSEPYEIEHRIVMKDGRVKFVRETGETLFANDGKPLRTTGVVQDRTERVEQEIALRKSERLLKDAQEVAHLGYLDWNTVTNDIIWSEETHRIYGFPFDFQPTIEATVGLVHPDDAERAGAALTAAIKNKEDYNIEHRIVRPDGKEVYIHAKGKLTINEQGEVTHMLGTIIDITRRREAEQALLDSELWMRSIYNSLDVAVLVVSVDRKIVNVNDAALNIFGYSADEVYNSSTNLFHVDTEHYEKFGKLIQKAFDKDEAANFEFVAKRKNGEVFPTENTVSLLKNSDGKRLGIVSVIRDISMRKQNENELSRHREHLEDLVKEGNQELYEREQQLKDAQRIAQLGNYEWDLKSNELSWSDTAFDLFEIEPGSVKPTPELFMEQIHPDDVTEVNAQMSKALSSTYPVNGERSVHLPVLDYRTIHSDGKIHWIRAEGIAILNDAGIPEQVHGTVQDITSHKRAEEIILASKDDAERANSAKSEFLSRMSHELRTPLNAILGFAQILKLDEEDFEAVQLENINEILYAGHHLLELINEVLDLSKIEAGELEVDMRTVEVKDVVTACFKLIEPQLSSRNIELIDHLTGKNFLVKADKMRFKQVILNLLSNAVKYNKEQGKIIIDGRIIDKKRLHISVTDTGNGLTEFDIAKLFTPFQRLNVVDNVEGTGIGLVITKRLVELMNGSVGVNSEQGKGSTFWIELEVPGVT